jgi:hypothetical protein
MLGASVFLEHILFFFNFAQHLRVPANCLETYRMIQLSQHQIKEQSIDIEVMSAKVGFPEKCATSTWF